MIDCSEATGPPNFILGAAGTSGWGAGNMIIDQKALDELSAKVKSTPRLRIALDLRNSPEDLSQLMMNALEPGAVMPVRSHWLCWLDGNGYVRLGDKSDNFIISWSSYSFVLYL